MSGKIFTVLSAERKSVYHYHGSVFEYTWRLRLKSGNNPSFETTLDTLEDHVSLVGASVRTTSDGDFSVVKEAA